MVESQHPSRSALSSRARAVGLAALLAAALVAVVALDPRPAPTPESAIPSAAAAWPTTSAGSSASEPDATAEADAEDPGMEVEGEGAAGEGREKAEAFAEMEQAWTDRLTYPTGVYNPGWVRRAAAQDAGIARGVPDQAGPHGGVNGTGIAPAGGGTTSGAAAAPNTTSLSTAGFTALGPQPETMTGCTGCYDYTTTAGRVNAIAIDPTTTVNGSIVAYAAAVGGGVWKTTNCCSAGTTWSLVTDSPLSTASAVDALAIDPNDHNTIYAGTGDANFTGFSFGAQGILKSTDAGATWTVVGADVFQPAYPGTSGQYNAVGKVQVDPNNSSIIAAGAKNGLFLSYNAGATWIGPCATNAFPGPMQTVTGLEMTDMGATTRLIVAIGWVGTANGANGLYAATMPPSGCPSFSSITSNANGFVFGAAVAGSPYGAAAAMNAGSGSSYTGVGSGNQLGRIDIAVAPSDPNVIYAQVQSIAANSASGCGNSWGCQLGAWVTTDGGLNWSFMTGSAGGSLALCSPSGRASGAAGSGDYAQNWYDQGVAVDPNNADRVFFATYDVYLATRTGTHWYDVTCGYSGTSPKPVHVDQHAIAFVAGSSSLLLLGNDGGVHGTANADAAVDETTRPTWLNLDGGFNTIEYYAGDISANFATSAGPFAGGGAQDNMDSFVTFSGTPTGPVAWQGNVGGDGFYVRVDGKGGYVYASNNRGQIHRCTSSCSSAGPVFSADIRDATQLSDRQSFAAPFDLFAGAPGATGDAECGARCNHLLSGTYRVWENTGADTGSTWTLQSGDLTKGTLGSRSYINSLHYAPADQTLGIAGTSDGNVAVLLGLGGVGSSVNVTGSNAVLPNRAVLDVVIDPRSDNTLAHPITGYATMGGFNATTVFTPGHVFALTCTVDCATSSWTDKTGNLPDIPVGAIAVNPNFPQQVFAGTDFGLYVTNDVTVASPVWYRFSNGMPSAMVWTLRIDRGATTLSVWTRGRGAYVWPLPSGPVVPTASIALPAIANTATPAVTWTITDPGTGIAGYLLSESATPPSPVSPSWSATAPAAHAFGGGDGPKTLYGWVKDWSGTVSATSTATTLIDTIAPTAKLTAPATPTRATSLGFTIAFSEAVGSVAAADFSVSGTSAGCVVGTPSGAGTSWAVALTGCGDGTVTLLLKAGSIADAAGNAGPSTPASAATVKVDRTAPTTPGAPLLTVRSAALSGTTLPATLSWAASTDGGVGLARYEVARTTDGGTTWTSLATNVVATSYSLSTVASGIVAYRLRAVDALGNTSGWTTGPTLQPRLAQESAMTFAGAWTTTTLASYAGGSARTTSVAGATATYSLVGRGVAIVAALGAGRGSFTVYVDGAAAGTLVPTAAGATSYQQVVWQRSWTATGWHKVQVVAKGDGPVVLDAVVSVFSDVVAPGAPGVPAASLRTGVSATASALPVSIAWTAAADNAGGSGVSSYQASRSTNGGATWSAVTAVTGSPWLTTIPTTGSVILRVRAVDRAGNAGPWATASAISPALVQTTSATGLSFTGTWSTASSTSYLGGSTRYATLPTATATYAFTGRSIAILSTRATSRGQLRVYVDGSSSYVTVDTNAAATVFGMPVWSKTWTSSGVHSIKIAVVGTGGHPRVDLDAFGVIR